MYTYIHLYICILRILACKNSIIYSQFDICIYICTVYIYTASLCCSMDARTAKKNLQIFG